MIRRNIEAFQDREPGNIYRGQLVGRNVEFLQIVVLRKICLNYRVIAYVDVSDIFKGIEIHIARNGVGRQVEPLQRRRIGILGHGSQTVSRQVERVQRAHARQKRHVRDTRIGNVKIDNRFQCSQVR